MTSSVAWGEAEWEISGRAVGVADGDTVTVLDVGKRQHKVRLAGCDAPERKQPYSARSKQNLSDLVYQQEVKASCYKKDRFGRAVCRVYRGAIDVCSSQIEAGLAWHAEPYAKEQTTIERATFQSLQRAAQDEKRGLWQDEAPLPPWEFRRRGRKMRAGAL